MNGITPLQYRRKSLILSCFKITRENTLNTFCLNFTEIKKSPYSTFFKSLLLICCNLYIILHVYIHHAKIIKLDTTIKIIINTFISEPNLFHT